MLARTIVMHELQMTNKKLLSVVKNAKIYKIYLLIDT
jgi:hypothetical protein